MLCYPGKDSAHQPGLVTIRLNYIFSTIYCCGVNKVLKLLVNKYSILILTLLIYSNLQYQHCVDSNTDTNLT